MIQHLFSADAAVGIQGITGKEGQRMAAWMISSGTRVVGGVTPGKGGQSVDGKPVFNTVAELKAAFPTLVATCVTVPAERVRGAVTEAIEAGVPVVYVLSERVPVHDVLAMRALAIERGVTLLGPSSVGYVQFPQFRLGYLGGERPFEMMKEGDVAVLSTSGGMANECAMSLARNGIGIRFALALGGDRVIGTTLEEAVDACEQMSEVRKLVLFVEPGQPLLAKLLSGERTLRKPTVLFLAGDALDDLPRGLPYGHTGTVVGEDDIGVRATREQLRERGLRVAGSIPELVVHCQQL